MSLLHVVPNQNGVLIVDSRLIAAELGIEHDNLMGTLRKYQAEIEEDFGGVLFETGVPLTPTGNPPKYALLTEDQATTLMTYSRNTERVRACKRGLIKSFRKAKQILDGVKAPAIDADPKVESFLETARRLGYDERLTLEVVAKYALANPETEIAEPSTVKPVTVRRKAKPVRTGLKPKVLELFEGSDEVMSITEIQVALGMGEVEQKEKTALYMTCQRLAKKGKLIPVKSENGILKYQAGAVQQVANG